MAFGAIIIAFYIAYLRYRFERYLALKGDFWNQEVDAKSKIKYLIIPFTLYIISIVVLLYYYSELERLAAFWVHFDLNGNPDILMPLNMFIAFNVLFGLIIFSPILISFPGRETIKFISKTYFLIFIIWLLMEGDVVYYNLFKKHFIAHPTLVLIFILTLSFPLLYITFKDRRY